MKHLFIYFLILFTASVKAQYFNEVKIDGTSTEYLAKIKAKGYVQKELFSNGNGAILKKELNELYVFWTPKTKLVYKVSIYMPKKDSWYGLKAEYQKYSELLTNKYGSASNTYEYFTKPYYEGDGYELSAVRLDKVTYFTFWDLSEKENTQIGLSISKYEQIEISYENYKNTLIKETEKKEIENKVF
jgi:hypothetical protein